MAGDDRNDIFDNEDDFSFDDSWIDDSGGASTGALDDFDFEDDLLTAGTVGDEPAFDEDFEEEDERGGNRPSPIFIVLAILLFLLILAGLAFLLINLVGETGPTSPELTATRIVQTNEAIEAQLTQTQAQSMVLAGTATAEAQLTASAPTATPTPTATDTPDFDATQMAQADAELRATQTQAALQRTSVVSEVEMKQTSAALRLTEIVLTQQAEDPTPTAEGGISIGDVALTATALADILGPGEGTEEPIAPSATPIGGAGGGQLPDTGLFDDIAAGGIGVFFLAALGLVGVIVLARWLRRPD
jgi:hypothetical protein